MQRQSEYNCVDLFCGAGGMSTGLKKARLNIVTGVDSNEHALDTYETNHNCSPLNADIRDGDVVQKIEQVIEDNGFSKDGIDAVVGGPPCKGFSMANVRTASEENPLNELPKRFIEIIDDLNPEVVLLENVPRLLTLSDGKFKDAIINSLNDRGYNVEYKVLNAKNFGVPQRRKRVFFIGAKNNDPIFPNPSGNNAEISVGEAISDLPELPTGGGGDEVSDYDTKEEEQSSYVKSLRSDMDSDILYNHKTTVNREKTYRRFEHIPQGGNWKDIPSNLMSNYTDRKRTHDHIYQRLEASKPAKTVANFRKQMMVHPIQDRLLSVREAARLQSFPDSYQFTGNSFNARQQMVGNAVPVRLAEEVGRCLYRLLANQHSSEHILN